MNNRLSYLKGKIKLRIIPTMNINFYTYLSLGFVEINYVPAFQEYEFEFLCYEENKIKILELTSEVNQEHYDPEE